MIRLFSKAIASLTFIVTLLSVHYAGAADYSAGDPCPASGALHTTNDADGVDVLVCDGTNWHAAISYFSTGGLAISSLSGQPAPQFSSAGGSSFWLQSSSDIYYPSGNVGIGSTNPNVELDVVGDINFTGTITDVSDRRQKENVAALEDALAKVISLNGYSFTMKDDPEDKIEYGLIAQEVEQVFPELVITQPDGIKTMNYLGMVAPLVEATKAQQDDLNRLRDEIAKLRAENAELRLLTSDPGSTRKGTE
jgi:hypothetical protein